MLLAELEIWHSRPIAPTRRVALGDRVLPVEPAPGFGGLLLGGIVAAHIEALDDDLRERSPVNRAELITAPLLILQGTDDGVVPPGQSQAIAERLKALGRTVEIHLYEGEGHGWGRAATVIDELARTESFLRRHVLRGGS